MGYRDSKEHNPFLYYSCRVESEYKEERGMQPIKSKEGGKNKFKNLIANAD